MPDARLTRTRRNYDDANAPKPLAQQQCKDCGAYALVPIPHKAVIAQADGDGTV